MHGPQATTNGAVGTAEAGGERVISVAGVFSRTPGGRYVSDGPDSGEEFRDRVLAPALREAGSAGNVVVDLDGVRYGYPTGWLEEVFGGIRRLDTELAGRITIRTDDAEVLREAQEFLTGTAPHPTDVNPAAAEKLQ